MKATPALTSSLVTLLSLAVFLFALAGPTNFVAIFVSAAGHIAVICLLSTLVRHVVPKRGHLCSILCGIGVAIIGYCTVLFIAVSMI